MSLVEWKHNDCNEHKRREVSVVHVDSSWIIDRFNARNSRLQACLGDSPVIKCSLPTLYMGQSRAFVGKGADDLGKMEDEENSEETKSRRPRPNRKVQTISTFTFCHSLHIVPLLSFHNLEQGRSVSRVLVIITQWRQMSLLEACSSPAIQVGFLRVEWMASSA
jgi:hypothetical protein